METQSKSPPIAGPGGPTARPAADALERYLAATRTEHSFGSPLDALELGYALALYNLGIYGGSLEAAQAVHSAWRDGMGKQYRDVKFDRRRWETLHPTDQTLDSMIAKDTAIAAVRALNGGNTPADVRKWVGGSRA
jgi:hypothetical protein